MALNIVNKGWLRKLIRLDLISKNIVLLEMKEFCENQKFPYTAIYIKSGSWSKSKYWVVYYMN